MTVTASPLLRIEHVALRVRDLEADLRWYRDVVGLREVMRTPTKVYLAVGDKPTWDLSLVAGGAGLEYFSVSVDDVDTLDRVSERLRSAGVRVDSVAEPDPQVLAAVTFALPGGQRVQIVVAEARINYTVATDIHFGAIHAPKELHHVTLGVTDIAALEELLVGPLEMGISDHVHAGPEDLWALAFWRFAENHHDIAAVRTPSNGLHHFAFIVSGVGDLVAMADRLVACGFPRIENGISRHGAGNNLFLYTRDPTGNIVEFSTDLARVTDRAAPHRVWHGHAAGNLWGDIRPPMEWLQNVT